MFTKKNHLTTVSTNKNDTPANTLDYFQNSSVEILNAYLLHEEEKKNEKEADLRATRAFLICDDNGNGAVSNVKCATSQEAVIKALENLITANTAATKEYNELQNRIKGRTKKSFLSSWKEPGTGHLNTDLENHIKKLKTILVTMPKPEDAELQGPPATKR